MPLPPVGNPAASMGMPRELKMTHELYAMSLPSASLQSGENPIAFCVFGGGADSEPKPNETPLDVRVATVSATHALVVLFQLSRKYVFVVRSTCRRARENRAAARIFASATRL